MSLPPSKKTKVGNDATVGIRVSSTLRDAYQAISRTPISDLVRSAMENEIISEVSKISSVVPTNVEDAIRMYAAARQEIVEAEYQKELAFLEELQETLGEFHKQREAIEQQILRQKQEEERKKVDAEIQYARRSNERDSLISFVKTIITPEDVEEYGGILCNEDGDPDDLIAPLLVRIVEARKAPLPEMGSWWITMYLTGAYRDIHPAEREGIHV